MSMCREKVQAFWDAHDKNKDGVLSADELRGGLKSSDQCKMSSDAVDVSQLNQRCNVFCFWLSPRGVSPYK